MQANTTIRLAAGDHVVRFYDDDDELVAVVVGYLANALARAEAAVVVATPDHARRFRAGFARAGIDVETAEAQSRLTILDAGETLASFTVGEAIDPPAFEHFMRPIVRRAREAGTDVCVYVEMVAVLFDEGQSAAALDLEACWNDLARRETFSLLCAYPSRAAAPHEDRTEAYADVCRLHSDVLGDQPVLDDAQRSCAFARSRHAPKQARHFVTDVLREWELAELVDRASLIVTELATNAVVHARSGFTVSLAHAGGVVRVAVGDNAAAVPQRTRGGAVALMGRGIPIIEALASRWGHLALDEGKLVWADIAARVPATPRTAPADTALILP